MHSLRSLRLRKEFSKSLVFAFIFCILISSLIGFVDAQSRTFDPDEEPLEFEDDVGKSDSSSGRSETGGSSGKEENSFDLDSVKDEPSWISRNIGGFRNKVLKTISGWNIVSTILIQEMAYASLAKDRFPVQLRWFYLGIFLHIFSLRDWGEWSGKKNSWTSRIGLAFLDDVPLIKAAFINYIVAGFLWMFFYSFLLWLPLVGEFFNLLNLFAAIIPALLQPFISYTGATIVQAFCLSLIFLLPVIIPIFRKDKDADEAEDQAGRVAQGANFLDEIERERERLEDR